MKRIKRKKQHEIDRIVELIKQIREKFSEIDSLIDIGAGVGHLSRVVAMNLDLAVMAVDGDEQFTIAAHSLDETVIGQSLRNINCPIRFTSFVTDDLAAKIDEFSQNEAILVGLHTCGDFSTTILNIFCKSRKAKSLILLGCCYHKQFQCFHFCQPGAQVSQNNDLNSIGLFPLSKKWKGVELGYVAREMSCHTNENLRIIVRDKPNFTRYARAHLEKWITKISDNIDDQNIGMCSVNCDPKMTSFEEYIKRASAKRGEHLTERILNKIREDYAKLLKTSLYDLPCEYYDVTDTIRMIFAPLIETCIIDDRVEFLREHGYTEVWVNSRMSIKFPFEPYECQKVFMKNVIDVLDAKMDAALESPTGTGKTLSLLCATLAWVQKQKELKPIDFSMMQSTSVDSAPCLEKLKNSFVPTIYYASRTHSQLEQVVHELNRTEYKWVKTAILGSREHFCIHPKVKKIAESNRQSHVCRGMVSKRTCHYYNTYEKTTEEKMGEMLDKGEAMDIEDFVKVGQTHSSCPYFMSRKRAETAELVLLPYNYVIDPKMRRRYKLDLKNSIVIFDEAHNLESICEANASAEITSKDVAMCIEELKKVLALLVEEEEEARMEGDSSTQAFGTMKMDLAKKLIENLRTEDLMAVLEKMFKLEEEFEKAWKNENFKSIPNLDGKASDGEAILAIFERVGLDGNSIERVVDILRDATSYLLSKGEDVPLTEKGDGMEKVCDFILSIFSTHAQDVAAAVGDSDIKLADRVDPRIVARNCKLYLKKDVNGMLHIKYFCFQASISMRMLKMRGVRNVLLASGTLSPIQSFTFNMGLNFGAILENEHALKTVPVVTSVVMKGYRNNITGSYANRSNSDYIADVAESLIRVLDETPQGVIVFFASYAQMQDLTNSWKSMKRANNSETFWEKMTKSKDVVVEPRAKDELVAVRAKYVNGVRNSKGAALFAVCRGKVSEGIDFCDAESRAVVIIGIPYPPINDERVVLKKMFLEDIKFNDNNKQSERQSSRDWYQMEAFRAVNQAIGRVLRHKDDFGAVVLIDSRYASAKLEMFPKWLRNTISRGDTNDCSARISRSSSRNIPQISLNELFGNESIPEVKEEQVENVEPIPTIAGGFRLPTNEVEVNRKRALPEFEPMFQLAARPSSSKIDSVKNETIRPPPNKKKLVLVGKINNVLPDNYQKALQIRTSDIINAMSEENKRNFAKALKAYKTQQKTWKMNGMSRIDEDDDSILESTSIGCSPLTRRKRKSVLVDKPQSPRKSQPFRFRRLLDSFAFTRTIRNADENEDVAEEAHPIPTNDTDVVTLLLEVRLNRGEELPVKDASGSSDPYVKFRYKEAIVYKSNTIFKNLNPCWDEDFQMIVDDVTSPLKIEVFDFDRFCTDDFMGSAEVELEKIKWSTPTELVLNLVDESLMPAGRVSLCVTLTPMTQQEVQLFAAKSSRSTNEKRKERTNEQKEWSKNVNLVLVEGDGVRIDETKSPDAFCKFKLGMEKYKTKVCSASSEPKWVEQFDMHIFDTSDQILQIVCIDRSSNTVIGRLSIDIDGLPFDETVQEWYPLEGSANAKIHLLITVSSSKNLATEIETDEFNHNDVRNARIAKYDIFNSFADISDIGVLTVKVFCAEDLVAKDFGGKSDPFVVVELVNTRVQTHTVYKTLNPHWNKIFSFAVKDIHTCLVLTVYDEDPNNRFEFLGRVSIPLISIRNCERRWYALKDEKLRKRVKGDILLEMDLIWNPIRAAIRTFKPKETKYIAQEQKFKASLFRATVMELKDFALSILSITETIGYLLSWQSKPKSAAAFVFFVLFVYFFEIYFLPLIILFIFAMNFIKRKSSDENINRLSARSKSEDEDDKSSSIRDTIFSVQETLVVVQNSLVFVNQLIERVQHTFNFTNMWLSTLAVVVLILAFILLYFVPLRWIILIWGINKFSKKLRNPNFVDNNEILDFLSRVPCRNDLQEQSNQRVMRPINL
ncbi:unnamed protein product [Caenorhabditis bovis]|uniref:Uncharacterized protein n=1 Tax=Caenorhabditis bovis TaxID=2654633 RepID=A0A8S1FAN0_9PELO|nr:unnamed protein product [Caenorhabditis bovis]